MRIHVRIRGKSACVKEDWCCVKSRLLQQQSELLLQKLAQWLSFTCNEIIIPPGRVRSIKRSPSHPPAPPSHCFLVLRAMCCELRLHLNCCMFCWLWSSSNCQCFSNRSFWGGFVLAGDGNQALRVEWTPGAVIYRRCYGRFDPRTLLRTSSPLETNKQSFKYHLPRKWHTNWVWRHLVATIVQPVLPDRFSCHLELQVKPFLFIIWLN